MIDTHELARLSTLLERLAPVAYPTLREHYAHNCCIAAGAVLTGVFAEYGFKAEPVPVTVEVYNAAMVDLLASGFPLPEDRQLRQLLFDLAGAWSVGIVPASAGVVPCVDSRKPGINYGGHLLLKVGHTLVDTTLRQAERPEKKILLPEMVWTNSAGELARAGHITLEVNGRHVVYRLLNDDSYRHSPAWHRRSAPYPETVQKILSRIREPEQERKEPDVNDTNQI